MTDFSAARTMMVDTQVRPSDVTKFPIIDAMLTVAREAYVPRAARGVAYADQDVAVAAGRVMLAPRTLAKMLDALSIQQSDTVLHLGAGLGYGSAVLGHMAEAVIAVEEDEVLAHEAEATLTAHGADTVVVLQGPLADGAAKHGPYDVVLIEGAIEALPQAVADQVKEGGRVAAIFAEGALGVCRVGLKMDGTINWRMAFNAGAPLLPGFGLEKEFSL